MPESIKQAFVQQFDTQMRLECGQAETRLHKAVTDRGTVTGESFTANMLEDDGSALDENNVRHGDTIWADAEHRTPVANMLDFYKALPVDRADEPKLLANPSGSYMNLLMRNKNRRIDDIIYAAGRGTQILKDGSSIVLPSEQKIAHGGTGMTKAKIIQTKKIFRANECDEHEGEEIFMTFDSNTLEDVLSDTTLTSADFMAVKMLQEGDVSGKWLGFNWIPFERLANDGTTFYNLAWAKTGIQIGTGFMEGNVQRRGDKKDTLQVSMAGSWGALRTESKKVVEIAFQ